MHVRKRCAQALNGVGLDVGHVGRILVQLDHRGGKSCPKSGDADDVFGSCAVAALLGSATNKGLYPGALLDVGKADSFRAVKLMSTAGGKLKRCRCEIQLEVGHRLYGITVKERSMVTRNF